MDQKLPISQSIATCILPRLIHFLTDSEQGDLDAARPVAINALLSFLATLAPDSQKRIALVCILIPVLVERAKVGGKDTYADLAPRLLAIAGANQSTFRSVIASLTPEQKTLMEEVLRAGGAGQSQAASRNGGSAEPTIALKMSFGK